MRTFSAATPILCHACRGQIIAFYAEALTWDLPVPLSPDDAMAGRAMEIVAEEDAVAAMPVDFLPRVGLIAAELVTNALKHGAGRVLVELRTAMVPAQVGILLAVSDEGPGFPPVFAPDRRNRPSLGMRLVTALSGPGGVWIDPADRHRILVRLVDPADGSLA